MTRLTSDVSWIVPLPFRALWARTAAKPSHGLGSPRPLVLSSGETRAREAAASTNCGPEVAQAADPK